MPVPAPQPSAPLPGGSDGPWVKKLGQMQGQSNYDKLPPWRRQVFERMSEAGQFLDGLIPPPLYQKVATIAEILKATSPMGDIVDANDNLRAAGRDLENGDYLSAAGHGALGGLSSLGLSEISKPVKAAYLAAEPSMVAAQKAIFAGVMSRIADHKKLKKALRLTRLGADPQTILNETGWFQGADRKWRFEIDDSQARFNPRVRDEITAPGFRRWRGKAAELVDHPQLLEAYPELAEMDTVVRNRGLDVPEGTFLSPGPPKWRPSIWIDTNGRAGLRELKSVHHEFMHPIQMFEGFAPGGSMESGMVYDGPKIKKLLDETAQFYDIAGHLERLIKSKAIAPNKIEHTKLALEDAYARIRANEAILPEMAKYEYYRRMGGEVEARNVERRLRYTPAQRLEISPSRTEDVRRDKQFLLPPIRY